MYNDSLYNASLLYGKDRKEYTMIYLDNCATTKPDRSVVESFQQVAETYYGNPSSIHTLGAEVERLQQKGREQAANILQVEPDELIFTSGGTEGNNIAIKGIAFEHKTRGNHIITTEIEHASVYEACKALESQGFTVTYLPVNEAGVVDLNALDEAITDDTILVSIMHVNNEIGSIQPIEKIGQRLKKYPKITFHVDAVQSLGKIPLHLKDASIDLCTFSGHKIHGLKGTGLLYVRNGTALFSLFHGGGQEQSIRSGTENVPGNIAFVRALRLIKEKEKQFSHELQKRRDLLMNELAQIPGIFINSPQQGAPHIMNVSVPPLKPEVVIHALYKEGIVISTQSACSSKQYEVSRILEACHLSKERASSGLRISLSYDTTDDEIAQFCTTFSSVVRELKEIME